MKHVINLKEVAFVEKTVLNDNLHNLRLTHAQLLATIPEAIQDEIRKLYC